MIQRGREMKDRSRSWWRRRRWEDDEEMYIHRSLIVRDIHMTSTHTFEDNKNCEADLHKLSPPLSHFRSFCQQKISLTSFVFARKSRKSRQSTFNIPPNNFVSPFTHIIAAHVIGREGPITIDNNNNYRIKMITIIIIMIIIIIVVIQTSRTHTV